MSYSCDTTFFLGPAFWLNHDDISAATSSIALNTGFANTRDAKAPLVPRCSKMFQVLETMNHLRHAYAWHLGQKPACELHSSLQCVTMPQNICASIFGQQITDDLQAIRPSVGFIHGPFCCIFVIDVIHIYSPLFV